jgi:hypothetical protein
MRIVEWSGWVKVMRRLGCEDWMVMVMVMVMGGACFSWKDQFLRGEGEVVWGIGRIGMVWSRDDRSDAEMPSFSWIGWRSTHPVSIK